MSEDFVAILIAVRRIAPAASFKRLPIPRGIICAGGVCMETRSVSAVLVLLLAVLFVPVRVAATEATVTLAVTGMS